MEKVVGELTEVGDGGGEEGKRRVLSRLRFLSLEVRGDVAGAVVVLTLVDRECADRGKGEVTMAVTVDKSTRYRKHRRSAIPLVLFP